MRARRDTDLVGADGVTLRERLLAFDDTNRSLT
jgi:hypothetical protein